MKDILVVEASEGIAGPVCGLQLGDLGARVIKVEPPEGDRSRGWGPPFVAGNSAPFLALNRNKESLVLAADGGEASDTRRELVRRADILIEHPRADVPAWADLLGEEPTAINERLIHIRITPNGDRGPWADWAGSELTAQAMSGYWRLVGSPAEPPLRHGVELAEVNTGMFAYQAAVAALIGRNRTGRGQAVDLSLLGTLMTFATILHAAMHDPDEWSGFHLLNVLWGPDTGFHTADGKVTLEFRRGRALWAEFCERVGLGHFVDDPRFEDWRATIYTGDNVAATREEYEAALKKLPTDVVLALVAEIGGTSVPHNDMAGVIGHPQTESVGILQTTPLPTGGSIRQVRTPFKIELADGFPEPRAAPTLDAHGKAILAELAGPPANAAAAKAPPPAPPPAPAEAASVRSSGGPLAGIRILDIGQAAVGPWGAMLLGQLGAEVIKIESPVGDHIHHVRPMQNGLGTTYGTMNLNKRGIMLDLKNEQDNAAAVGLASQVDVVLENFRPGVVERLGIDYETIRARNPGVVYLSVTGFGHTGPMRDVGCTDQHCQAFCGNGALNGAPGSDGQLMRYYAHHDLNTAAVVAQGILTALWERERTGKGQRVETSMLQAGLALQRVRLSEYFASGRQPPRLGSGISYCVPDQAFRCGDGKYLAVTASSEAEWRRFCAAMDMAHLAEDPRFATNGERVRNRHLLVPLLEDRFREHVAGRWELDLRRARVPVSYFLDYCDRRDNRHIIENEMVVGVDKQPWGELMVGGLPWQFSRTPVRITAPPYPGEDTRQVMEETGLTANIRENWTLPPRER